jgi:hypothetical protein
MMHTHLDNRKFAEMSEQDRLDRIDRILESLASVDGPRFNFYEHEHEQVPSDNR